MSTVAAAAKVSRHQDVFYFRPGPDISGEGITLFGIDDSAAHKRLSAVKHYREPVAKIVRRRFPIGRIEWTLLKEIAGKNDSGPGSVAAFS